MSQRTNLNRRQIMRVAGGGAAALALATSACSSAERDTLGGQGDDNEPVDLSGRPIKIAYANENPYAFYNPQTKQIEGQSVALHTHILEQFGADSELIEWVDPTWDGLIPGLGNTHDIVVAGMFINESRCAQVAFADPDYVMPDALLVKPGNPLDLHDINDAVAHDEAVLGVMNATTEQEIARSLGLEGPRLNTQQNLAALILELKAGRCDAIALTYINLKLEAESDSELELTEPFFPTDADGNEIIGAGAAVFHADDTRFRDQYNEKLAEVLADPQLWESLVGPYGFTVEANLPPSDMTAESLCPENYQ